MLSQMEDSQLSSTRLRIETPTRVLSAIVSGFFFRSLGDFLVAEGMLAAWVSRAQVVYVGGAACMCLLGGPNRETMSPCISPTIKMIGAARSHAALLRSIQAQFLSRNHLATSRQGNLIIWALELLPTGWLISPNSGNAFTVRRTLQRQVAESLEKYQTKRGSLHRPEQGPA